MIDVHQEAHNLAIRRLEEALRPVDERLHQWGKETKNGKPRLYYPSQSSHLRIPGGDFQEGPSFISPEVEEVDACISKLKEIRQKVLAIAYMHFPNLPPDFQRRKLNMSRHKWKIVLRESRIVVGAMLGYQI